MPRCATLVFDIEIHELKRGEGKSKSEARELFAKSKATIENVKEVVEKVEKVAEIVPAVVGNEGSNEEEEVEQVDDEEDEEEDPTESAEEWLARETAALHEAALIAKNDRQQKYFENLLDNPIVVTIPMEMFCSEYTNIPYPIKLKHRVEIIIIVLLIIDIISKMNYSVPESSNYVS